MEDLRQQLDDLEPELARNIRDALARTGLQDHDPAARLITEMWVAVAALKQERGLLHREISDLAQKADKNSRYLLALMALASINLLGVLILLSA
jgi:cytochrome c-type biogenesis protein CcmH/NrfG